MIELPEATTLAAQAGQHLSGRTVVEVEANQTPHKLTWYNGEPDAYRDLLAGDRIAGATSHGGILALDIGDHRLLLSDGAHPRLFAPGAALPPKHQLKLTLDDGAALVVTTQMYGGIQAFPADDVDYHYYRVALAAPSPLSADFGEPYFAELLAQETTPTLSAKAFLATEQRIPGVGNGVLQDILWHACINPRCKVATLTDEERGALHQAIVTTLRKMTDDGGRNTERDLLGEPGGYDTILCRATLERPCRRCGDGIIKEAYLGGAVYYCPTCQPV